MEKTIFAGITPDNELYFLTISPKSKEHKYFSMSGFTIQLIKVTDAEDQARECLGDGELWKMAVEANNTTDSLADWVEYVLDMDGWERTLDNSLYTDVYEIDGEDWGFLSLSCGQHEQKVLKYYTLPKIFFNNLMQLWKDHHLKEKNPDNLSTFLQDPAIKDQNTEKEVIKAVKWLMENEAI